jgi:hypothetical protein
MNINMNNPVIKEALDAAIKAKAEGTAAAKTASLKEIVDARKKAMAEGKALGKEVYGKGSLGKVTAPNEAAEKSILATRKAQLGTAGKQSQSMQDLLAAQKATASTAGNRSADITDVIARRKAGLEGFNAEENTALKEQMAQQVSRAEQGALRQLKGAQAGAGIRGGLAGAQTSDVLMQGQQQRANAARDLFLQNIQQKQQALGAFEGSARAAEGEQFARQQQATGQYAGQLSGEEAARLAATQAATAGLEGTIGRQGAQDLGIQQFNLGQTAKEKYGQLATQLGMAGLSSQETASAAQEVLGKEQTDAMMNSAKGGKK